MKMFEECIEKQNQIKNLFSANPTEEGKYEIIIDLGRKQKELDPKFKIPENIVKGCQSILYLYSYNQEGKIYFETASEALISSGLAAVLTKVYSGETPETILKCPPNYIHELGISASLSPNRANGLYSIHLKMKQDALKLLIEIEKSKIN
jgi:cysteine desulfuration protein SufE